MDVCGGGKPAKLRSKVGKIPENPSPVPDSFSEIFWGFSPKKSPKIESSPSPKYPQTFQGFYPRPHPRFLGIFGDRTPKKLKIKPIPVPEKSPKFFQSLSPSPLCHQNLGMGTGKFGDSPILFTNLKLNGTRVVSTWVLWVQLHQQFLRKILMIHEFQKISTYFS